MSDAPVAPDWWQAWDGKWYAPDEEPPWAESVDTAPAVPSQTRSEIRFDLPDQPADESAAVGSFEQWSRRHEVAASERPMAASDSSESPDSPEIPPAPVGPVERRPANQRRRRLVALVVAGSVVVAWMATAFALAAGSNAGLSRMSPSEILQTSERAAIAAGTVHVDIEETTSLGQQTSLSADASPIAGEAKESAGFTQFSLVVARHTIYVDGNVSYWVTVAPGAAVSVENRWVSLPAGSSVIASQLLSLASERSFIQDLSLIGPLTLSGSGSPAAGTVVIRGFFPPGGFEPTVATSAATLTISTSAPYLPAALDVRYAYGTISMRFSNWGERVSPRVPPSALPLQTVDPLLTQITNADAVAQGNVQKALTGVEVYGSSTGGSTHPSFAGLGSDSWPALNTGVDAVFGQPSNGPDEISIDPQTKFAVMTAWAPAASGSTGTCWGILDDDAGPRLLGYKGPATVFFESPERSYLDCRASRFAGARPPAGVVSSSLGFNWLS